MKGLARKIKAIADGLKIRIVASTAPRGEQSGQVMADELGVPLELADVLWSQPAEDGERERSVRLGGALQLIDPEKDVVFVMVTHLEYSMFFPCFYIENVLKGRPWHGGDTEKGEAWLIDCVTHEVTRVKWHDN